MTGANKHVLLTLHFRSIQQKMSFQIGDKVKFLNAKGGGIVKRIIDSRMVGVAVEGGFEIPTLVSELISIEGSDPGARFFEEYYDVVMEKDEKKEEGDKTEDRLDELPLYVTRNRKSEDIFLLFVPHDQKWLIAGLLDVLLINNSSYDLLYNLFLQKTDNTFKGKDYGSCFPDSRLLIDTITREQLPEWTYGYLQFLFHKESATRVFPPFNSEFRISGQKFYNEASYKETPFADGKAIAVKLLSLTNYLQMNMKQENRSSGRITEKEEEALIFRHQSKLREAEVDLHIEELLEDHSSLKKEEILDFQVSYFERCLDSAIFNHFLKVTFIHGIGNGILRETILRVLKKHEGIEVFDAPMQKYGVGAIEVRIPHNQ